MGKVSNNASDAIETSIGIQEGNVEIVGAVCKVHQFPPNKKNGNQSEPFSCVALKFQKLDADFEATEADPEWAYLSLGKDSLDKYHPGNLDNADDDEPTDEGDDVDTEGNCINAINDDKLNKKCKWMIMSASLAKEGFKPEILGKGFLSDLVGVKGHVKTEKMEKIEGSEKEPTVLIFDKIVVFPYSSKKGSKGKEKDADKGKDKGDKNGKGSSAASKASMGKSSKKDDDDNDESGSAAADVLAAVAKKMSGETIPIKKLVMMAQSIMIQTKVPGKDQKPIKAQLEDLAWIAEQEGIDGIDTDDNTVSFS